MGMKAILSGHTGSTNVSTNRISFAPSFGGSVSPTRDQSTRHVLVLCGVFFFTKSKQTRRSGESYLFDVFLLALQKIRVHLDLDPAAFGAKLSLEKSGRDRREEKLLALSVENPPGQQLQKPLRDSGV